MGAGVEPVLRRIRRRFPKERGSSKPNACAYLAHATNSHSWFNSLPTLLKQRPATSFAATPTEQSGFYGMNSMLTCLAVTFNLATNLTASQFSMAYNSQLNLSRGATR